MSRSQNPSLSTPALEFTPLSPTRFDHVASGFAGPPHVPILARAMNEMDTRLTELELRYTELQHFLEELSGVVRGQQRTIDVLEAQVRLLQKKLEADPGVTEASAQERPPHY